MTNTAHTLTTKTQFVPAASPSGVWLENTLEGNQVATVLLDDGTVTVERCADEGFFVKPLPSKESE